MESSSNSLVCEVPRSDRRHASPWGTGFPPSMGRAAKRPSPSEQESGRESQDASPHSCITAFHDDQAETLYKRMRSQSSLACAPGRPHTGSRLAVASSAGSFPCAEYRTSQPTIFGAGPTLPLLSCMSAHDCRTFAPSSRLQQLQATSLSRRSSCCSDSSGAALTPLSSAQGSSCLDVEEPSCAEHQLDCSPAHPTLELQQPIPAQADQQQAQEQDEVQSWLSDEARFTPQSVFATQAASSKLTPSMREMLVEWMCEVTLTFGLQMETFLLSVNYLDRCLSASAVSKQQLQLLGAACLWLASKYEDVHPPSAQQMADMTENSYSTKQIAAMEAHVARVLCWNLAVPCSSLKFLQAFAERAQVTSRSVLALSECLLQLAALDGAAFVHAPASRVAACVLSVALAACGQTAGIPHVVKAAQWRDNDELAHMSKELYARFTRMLTPGARSQNCIITQYLARQRLIACTPSVPATPAHPPVSCAVAAARTLPVPPPPQATQASLHAAATCFAAPAVYSTASHHQASRVHMPFAVAAAQPLPVSVLTMSAGGGFTVAAPMRH